MIILKSFKVSLLFVVCTSILVSAAYGNTTYKVKSSDSLSRIADIFYKDSELSRDQLYVGILAENPKAFNFGNINYLQNGRLLNLPKSAVMLVMEEGDAVNLVSEHNDYAKRKKKIRMPVPFKNYSPKGASLSVNNPSSIAKKQQTANKELENLSSETEKLRIRLEKLQADKQAMDEELIQLDGLIKGE